MKEYVRSHKIMDVSEVQVSDKDGEKSHSNTIKANSKDRERANLEARFSFRQQDCDRANLDHF